MKKQNIIFAMAFAVTGVSWSQTNQVSKFNSTLPVVGLSSSQIYDDGTKVGIGTNSPAVNFHSNMGTFRISDPGSATRNLQIVPNYGGYGDLPAGTTMFSGINTAGEGLSFATCGGGNDAVKIAACVYTGGSWKSIWESQNNAIWGSLPSLLLVKSGGKVGIGTTLPSQKLHMVDGALLMQGMVSGVGGPNILLGGTSPNAGPSSAPYGEVGIEYNPTAHGLNFWKPAGSHSVNGGPLVSTYGNGGNYGLFLSDDGLVGIGTAPSTINAANYQYRLSVNGGIRAKEITVEIGWADYVFNKEYKLKSLGEVETFIAENHHLPNIPSAKDIEEKGLNVGEVQAKQMEKIEELTLYIIELNKKLELLEKKVGNQ